MKRNTKKLRNLPSWYGDKEADTLVDQRAEMKILRNDDLKLECSSYNEVKPALV